MNNDSRNLLGMHRLIARKGEASPAHVANNRSASLFAESMGFAHPLSPALTRNSTPCAGEEDADGEADDDGLDYSGNLSGLIKRRTTPSHQPDREKADHDAIKAWRTREAAVHATPKPLPPRSTSTEANATGAEEPTRHQLTVRLPEPLFVRLRKIAKASGQTYQAVQKEAITQYLDKTTGTQSIALPETPRDKTEPTGAVITRRTLFLKR